MRGLRTAACVAALLVLAGCGSSATTTTGASATPISGAASAAPAASEAPTENESTGPSAVVGSEPGTISVTVGTQGAGFADAICEDQTNGQLSVLGGTAGDDAIALVFRADGTASSLSGEMRGVRWKVTQNPQGTLNADRSGTFSGKDAISGADVSGTFACK